MAEEYALILKKMDEGDSESAKSPSALPNVLSLLRDDPG